MRIISAYLIFTLAFFLSLNSYGQDGNIDPTFNPGDAGFFKGFEANSAVLTTAIQSDGKIIIGGVFTLYNGVKFNHIARLNTDGSPDLSFNVGTGTNGNVNTVILQSDGKIIIGGNFFSYNGVSRNNIARLNSDGSLDLSFNVGTGTTGEVKTISIQSDNKIIIGGGFTGYNGTFMYYIARLNTDGSLDATFNIGTGATGSVLTTVIQPDGKILIGGNFTSYNGTTKNYLARLNTNGSLDATFTGTGNGPNSSVETISIQSDGKIIVGGMFTIFNGVSKNRLCRVNTNGSLDASFTIEFGIVGNSSYNFIHTTSIQSDGKIIIGGEFTDFSGAELNSLTRLNTDGSKDVSFNVGTGTEAPISTTSIQADGKLIIGGGFRNYNGIAMNRIARINTDGTLDSTFYISGTGANEVVNTIAVQNDGKILIGGYFTGFNSTAIISLARLYADGTLDTTFKVGKDFGGGITSIVLQNDGKILIGGHFAKYNGISINFLARLNTDGTFDHTFNSSGTGPDNSVYTISLQADGKIIIGGGFYYYNGTAVNRFARLFPDGTLDASFKVEPWAGGASNPYTTSIQADGKIIVGGDFTSSSGGYKTYLAQLNTDGTRNIITFSGANNYVYASAIQNNGKVLIGGVFTNYNYISSNHLARINPNGTLDGSFAIGSGIQGAFVSAIAVQNDGKIIIGGTFTGYKGTTINNFARLNTDGSLDTTFNVGTGIAGLVPNVGVIRIQNDSKIMIGGYFSSYNGTGRNCIARLKNTMPPAVSLSATINSIPEMGGTATITATSTVISPTDITVNLNFSGSAGGAGVDYTSSDNKIIIPAGNLSGSITINSNDDLLEENNETIIVSIQSVVNAVALGSPKTITIIDDDAPEINLLAGSTSIVNGSGIFDFGLVAKGDSSTVTFTIENTGNIDLQLSGTPIISVSGANASEFKVKASSTSSVIAAGASTNFSITYIPGCGNSKNASISILNNDADESSYTFALKGTSLESMAPVPNTAILSTINAECSVTLTAPTATDNCDGTIVATTTDPKTYSSHGSYSVVWTYTDASGNSVSQTQTVNISESVAPVPNLASLSTINAECSITLTAPTATDNCDGTIVATTTDPITYTSVGSYSVVWTYTDFSGNSASQTQTVNISALVAPVPNLAVLPIIYDECSVTLTAPAATDNCDGTIIATTTDPITYTSQGAYSVLWTYTDLSGNSASQTQNLYIYDLTNPSILCPGDITVSTPTNSTVVNYSIPIGTDNCTGALTSLSTGLGSGSVFPVGVSTESYTVTDYANHNATCSFNVTVEMATGITHFSKIASAIYPNPSIGIFNMNSTEKLKEMKVYNNTGALLKNIEIQGYNEVIDLSEFGNGLYFVHITTEAGMIEVGKLTVLK